MTDLIGEAVELGLSVGAYVLKGGLALILPDFVGYAYMFCGAYVMLKALTGANNILRPIAVVSGITVVALAVIA